ncbi:unnamed protein product [Moneuplotes crassus]|uniref:Uncharacterized protein n=1 Tax=Euplotes crassus TaxID=5936 RepID=A0AAD1XZD1_EUPCR|nr:unnamed protein product [Moneuplotes crassus]
MVGKDFIKYESDQSLLLSSKCQEVAFLSPSVYPAFTCYFACCAYKNRYLEYDNLIKIY